MKVWRLPSNLASQRLLFVVSQRRYTEQTVETTSSNNTNEEQTESRYSGEVRVDLIKENIAQKRKSAWEVKREELEKQKEAEKKLVEDTGRKIAKVGRVSPLGETKRWFKAASVEQYTSGKYVRYRPLLDDRIILTPEGNMMWSPSKLLSAAVAVEWEAQARFIIPYLMPLTGMCCTALDSMPQNRANAISTLLGFLQTDTLCFRANRQFATRLYNLQVHLHQPIIDWFQRRFDCTFNVVEHGRFDFPDHSELLMQKARFYLHACTDFELTSLYVLAENAKSFVIALALFEGNIDSQNALLASRTEEHVQIETNGYVEAEHDVTDATVQTMLAAGTFFGRVVRGLERE